MLRADAVVVLGYWMGNLSEEVAEPTQLVGIDGHRMHPFVANRAENEADAFIYNFECELFGPATGLLQHVPVFALRFSGATASLRRLNRCRTRATSVGCLLRTIAAGMRQCEVRRVVLAAGLEGTTWSISMLSLCSAKPISCSQNEAVALCVACSWEINACAHQAPDGTRRATTLGAVPRWLIEEVPSNAVVILAAGGGERGDVSR